MKRLTLVVDERELSTIEAALLLLQEQISALPEDLAEMMSEHGPAMTEREIGRLARRLAEGRRDKSHTREVALHQWHGAEVAQPGGVSIATG